MKLKFVSILLLSACFFMVSCGDRQSTSSVKGENRVSESHSVATNKTVMDQFVTFINTGDTIIGKEIILPMLFSMHLPHLNRCMVFRDMSMSLI